ncbi:MAG: ComEC/Rec2 family competence protein [Rikenellaceae bacterium]
MLSNIGGRTSPQLMVVVAFFLMVGLYVGWLFEIDIWALYVAIPAVLTLYIVTRRSLFLPIALVAIGLLTTTLWRSSNENIEVENHQTIPSEINNWACERLEELTLSDDAQMLAKSMLLGRRDLMSRELRSSYNQSGAAHILAVSGLHLILIYSIISFMTRILHLIPYGHIARKILIIGVLWGYAAVVGMNSSVVRAAIMVTVLQVAEILNRGYSSMGALSCAVVFMAIFNPSILFNIGFWLSVIAVFAIVIWALPAIRLMKRWLYTQKWSEAMQFLFETSMSMLIVGGVCTIALMPLISYIFGYISILGVLLNPLIISTAYIIILLSFLWVLFGITWLAPLFATVIESMAQLQNFAVRNFAISIDLRLGFWEMIAVYALYIVITIFLYSKALGHNHFRPKGGSARYV